MASRGRGARQKGFNFERAVAKLLTGLTGFEWKRGLGQTRGGGAEHADVISEHMEDIHVECKRHKSVSIKKAMEQAVGDRDPGDLAVVITKDDRKDILVTMLWDDWALMFDVYTANR
jgi:hypothetical protein